ncbi:MAG: TraR/DksA C4-type zinc finger protein [Candidatus Neomarinimicrobiota bacterium]
MAKKKLTKAKLNHFKTIILEKQEKALAEMGYIRKSSLDDTGNLDKTASDSTYAYHMADVGTDSQEREKSFLWYTRENNFIRHLDNALERIRQGTYGFCVECGNPIMEERLEEVPHTQHCVNCKNHQNR